MAAIRSKDTSPELIVRSHVHKSGLRYRLHVRALPGTPDLVFPKNKLCVFVHGCFWHGCEKCVDGTRTVKSNVKFWRNKITCNRQRDVAHCEALKALGWSVYTVWECQLRCPGYLNRLVQFIQTSVPPSKRFRKVQFAPGSLLHVGSLSR
jgi:DNA mismatch endonuclease (patch repair protein)